MNEVLKVEERAVVGTSSSRRMRREGRVPAVLYGHGEKNVSLALRSEQVAAALRHGAKMVELQGAVNDTALISEVQWDAFGAEVLHVDLMRVSATESVEVTVPLELRGTAQGALQGGQLQHMLHEVTISCPANVIPEKLELKVNDLGLDQSLTLADVPLPDKVTIVGDLSEVVVQCLTPVAEGEAEGGVGGPAEPEVIRRRAEQEEEAD